MGLYESYGISNSLVYDEEDMSKYKRGGYHPVALRDTFKYGRYEIYHKLGHGGFSTVWVARDNESVIVLLSIYRVLTSHRLKQWVSVKIMTAESTGESRELRTLRALERHAKHNL